MKCGTGATRKRRIDLVIKENKSGQGLTQLRAMCAQGGNEPKPKPNQADQVTKFDSNKFKINKNNERNKTATI